MKLLKLLTFVIASVVRHFWLGQCRIIKPTFIAGLILVFISLGGCRKESTNAPKNTPANAPPGTVLLAPGVVKVDSTAALSAALLSVDSVSVTFKDVAASEKLQTGNILSSGISAIAPLGFLRKVISVTTSGGTVVCNTVMARLSDAVLNTAVNRTFSSDELFRNLPDATSVAGRAGLSGRNRAQLSVGISKSIPFTHNFGVVTVSGTISISGTLQLALTMSGARVTEFKADFVTVKSVTITASNGQSFSGSLSYQLPPIELPPLEFDAGVPVTFEAQLLLTIGVTCDLSENISVSVTNTATDEVGESYESGTWAPINNETHSFTSEFPKFTAAATLDPYAKLTLRLIPFGITDLALSGNVDLDAQASVPLTAALSNNTITANAKFDLDFDLDADLRAFDLFNLKYQYDWPTIALPLYSSTYTIGNTSGGSGGTGGTGSTGGNGSTGGTGSTGGNGSTGGTGSTGGNGSTGGTGSTGGNGSTGGTGGTGSSGNATTGQLVIQNGTNMSFGNVPLNTTGTITLPMVNEGHVPITIYSVAVNSPFSISPTTATVPANGSVNLTLSFTPTSAAYFNSPVTISSNAANPTANYFTDGTGTASGNSGNSGNGSSGSGPSNGSKATSVPEIGAYTGCLAVTQNASCSSFTDGVVHARVTSVDETNHTITFEVANCNGSAFGSPSTLYVYKGLCGGSEVGGVNFPATVYSYQITVNEPDMTGTKSYNVFVQQVINNQFISYDAQVISITF